MAEEIIKIIKNAGKQRHQNHINAGKMNWERVRLKAKKEMCDDIEKLESEIKLNLMDKEGFVHGKQIIKRLYKLRLRYFSTSKSKGDDE